MDVRSSLTNSASAQGGAILPPASGPPIGCRSRIGRRRIIGERPSGSRADSDRPDGRYAPLTSSAAGAVPRRRVARHRQRHCFAARSCLARAQFLPSLHFLPAIPGQRQARAPWATCRQGLPPVGGWNTSCCRSIAGPEIRKLRSRCKRVLLKGDDGRPFSTRCCRSCARVDRPVCQHKPVIRHTPERLHV